MYLIIGERHWYYQYIPYTKAAEYDRAITSYDFDKEPFQVDSEYYFRDL
jgi:hypothetical protein